MVAFEGEEGGVAAMVAVILGRGGLAGPGTGTGGLPGVAPICLYLLEGSHKIAFVSSKSIGFTERFLS